MAGCVEEVKAALEAGEPTISTVASLGTLLGLQQQTSQTPDAFLKPKSNGSISKTTAVRNTKTPAVRQTKQAAVAIHEDASKTLSGRDKYALATHTINHGLKLLSNSVKSRQKLYDRTTSPNLDAEGKTSDAASARPLQPLSGNISPVRSTPKKASLDADISASSSKPVSVTTNSCKLGPLVQCTQQGFAFLLKADFQALGVKPMPQWQLETGLLALVGSLTSHGLDETATKHLRIVKRRLEAVEGSGQLAKGAKSSRNQDRAVEKPLASLLHLELGTTKDAATLGVAITYYQHTIKLLSRNPQVFDELPTQFAVDLASGPVDLIVRHAKATKDFAKAAKQLEGLSQTLIRLVNDSNESDDGAQQLPCPEVMLKLTTIALQIRKLWWKLAKHQADVCRELLDPFSRCAQILVRRQRKHGGASHASELLETCLKSIGPFDQRILGNALLPIHNLLCIQTERERRFGSSQEWADLMLQGCESLEPNHARLIAARIRATACTHWQAMAIDEMTISLATVPLQSKISGSSADYDVLVEAIGSLSSAMLDRGPQSSETVSLRRLLLLGSAFCQRYARSYPERKTQQIIAIINAALRFSPTMDDLLSWISRDCAMLFIETGVLRPVADLAATGPLMEVWSASQDSLSLSRIVNTLLFKALKHSTEVCSVSIVDDEKLDCASRGTLLEWQLQCVVDLAPRAKYHEQLKKLLPELLKRLAKVYGASDFPIRRMRTATLAFAIREAHSELIPPHVLKAWQDRPNVDVASLGQDVGLATFRDDISARYETMKQFSEGRPGVYELRANLSVWRSIVSSCEDGRTLHHRIDEPMMLRRQLRSITAYFRMLGEDGKALSVHHLLVKLNRLLDPRSEEFSTSLMDLARNYLDLGYSSKVSILLEESANERQKLKLCELQRKTMYAELFFAVDQYDKCRTVLNQTRSAGTEFPLEATRGDQQRTYQMLLARNWLLCSKLMLALGSAKESLRAGKRSVQLLNAIWTSIERVAGIAELQKPDTEDDKAVSGISRGISKLQLTSTGNGKGIDNGQLNKRGAAFWPVLPVIVDALLHISDVYTHHGLFNEADYYSQRAIDIAMSVGSTTLLSRIRSHRCRLLTLAGRIEDAELCIVQESSRILTGTGLADAERICAKAAIKIKEGNMPAAVQLYEEAEQIVNTINSSDVLAKLEGLDDSDSSLNAALAVMSLGENTISKVDAQPSRKTVRKPARTPVSRAKPAAERNRLTKPLASAPNGTANVAGHYALSKLKNRIAMEKAVALLKHGEAVDDTPVEGLSRTCSIPHDQLLQQRQLVYKATAALEANVTLSLLTESTLSCPGIVNRSENASQPKSSPAPPDGSSRRGKVTARMKPPLCKAEDSTEAMLAAARDKFAAEVAAQHYFANTVATHSSHSCLFNVSLLASAYSTGRIGTSTSATNEAMALDCPRIKALQLEKGTLTNDGERIDDSRHIAWPEIEDVSTFTAPSPSNFQSRFIDILPRPWTAVSLCLSEDGRDLFIARYRAGVAPLTLKLPFARHKPGDDDDVNEVAFDYHKGKAELQEIIATSNYTCHHPGNLNVKGAKSNWWKEREELDRRLHELLINIESMWLGGFKSILSVHRSDQEALSSFRAAFEQVLRRYLPSRKGKKSTTQDLSVDDQILELFIGLETLPGTSNDIDEPVTDLLYFVVDLLQFRGERNAYDEIDFDSMTIDVIDAIRKYHETGPEKSASSQHLILVLDRRLQAFPWESLPCLEGTSVSRVSSMLSLHDCVISMRRSSGAAAVQNEGIHTVSPGSGTYVLNPSSDLTATQAMLEPSLSSLGKLAGRQWASIVNRMPSEEDFRSALASSSVTLYFGHGAGTQYIRPRTIKRLERCSEVVWLMGCSSGAIWENGDLEPSAVPLAYLLAGDQEYEGKAQDSIGKADGRKCLSVLATLWDVTDKDIDRFSIAVGEDWGLWPPSAASEAPAKTPRKREIVAQPSTPVQVPKTPKTPKARQTPAIAKTPATIRRSGKSPKDRTRKLSLVEAVARSRDVCTLRYLNGAAPVVYGVPVYLED